MKGLILFAEDFPAKTSVSPAKVLDSQEVEVACGMNSTGLSKKPSRNTRSSKMLQPFDLEDWNKCSGRSLRSGMMRSGTVYPLPPLAHLTDGIGSGLLPTPTAKGNMLAPSMQKWKAHRNLWATPTTMDHLPPKSEKAALREMTVTRKGRTNWTNLRDQVVKGKTMKLWPTPRANKIGGYSRSDFSPTLEQAVKTQEQFPTPHANCHTGIGQSSQKQGSPNLQTVIGGTLNPAWVEWLMGYPIGWTDLSS